MEGRSSSISLELVPRVGYLPIEIGYWASSVLLALGVIAKVQFCLPPRLLKGNRALGHSSCARNVNLGYNVIFPSRRKVISRNSWIRCGLEGESWSEAEREPRQEAFRARTVAIFWDLDNKPPNSVPPLDAALRLKNLGSEFGEVVDMVAYANKNAFTHVPVRVREERQDRRLLDQLERRGLVKVEQPYVCSMCGSKCKTNYALKRHFKQLHERERQKRMSYLKTLKGKKRDNFMEKVSDRELRYKEAARTVIVPKLGYGLAGDLKRAGVQVRTVESKPQAADEALIKHMSLYINRGLDCLILVSDDSDFVEILRYAKSRRLFTVVVGDTYRLKNVADSSFLWEDVASGRARLTARGNLHRWLAEDSLRAELQEEEYLGDYDAEEVVFFPESEDGYLDDDDEDPSVSYEDVENEADNDYESVPY
ncbi:hypothetical protein R1sor_015660 [Riccia sorocarpa]|uniref:C2H2-type domain-containing protein n=1 Tax=Riccia sorocarpa TaxID=122646 RepID=A0ABD3HH09_9MARC